MITVETTKTALELSEAIRNERKDIGLEQKEKETFWAKRLMQYSVVDFEEKPNSENFQKLENAMRNYQNWALNIKCKG